MGIFDTIIYPGNESRSLRVAQLSQDCADFAFELASDKEKIEFALADANKAIKEAYESEERNIHVNVVPVTIDPDNWTAYTAEIILPVLSGAAATKALNTASKAFLVRQGRIGEAAFADLVGLPRWFKVGKIMGGLAVAIAITGVIEAIDGGIQREKMRDAIHKLIEPRVQLKQNAMINASLLTTVNSVTTAYNAYKNIKTTVPLTPEQLDGIAHYLVNENKFNVDSITLDTARAALAEFDNGRHAWTNEDNYQ